MPLLQPILAQNLTDLMTMEAGKDVTPQDWADAIGGYFQQAVAPFGYYVLPTGATVTTQAKQAFVLAIGPKFPPVGALTVMKLAFTQFAITAGILSSGLPSGQIYIPPPIPIILEGVIPVGMSGAPAVVVANQMATIIDL